PDCQRASIDSNTVFPRPLRAARLPAACHHPPEGLRAPTEVCHSVSRSDSGAHKVRTATRAWLHAPAADRRPPVAARAGADMPGHTASSCRPSAALPRRWQPQSWPRAQTHGLLHEDVRAGLGGGDRNWGMTTGGQYKHGVQLHIQQFLPLTHGAVGAELTHTCLGDGRRDITDRNELILIVELAQVRKVHHLRDHPAPYDADSQTLSHLLRPPISLVLNRLAIIARPSSHGTPRCRRAALHLLGTPAARVADWHPGQPW